MSREQNEGNVYGFTTTKDDNYIIRVVEEATQDTDFIFLTERDTLEGFGTVAQVVVRKNALLTCLLDSTLTLGGRPVIELLIDTLEGDVKAIKEGREQEVSAWSVLSVSGAPADLAEELERVRNEVRRIKNIIDGRTVRVHVESF